MQVMPRRIKDGAAFDLELLNVPHLGRATFVEQLNSAGMMPISVLQGASNRSAPTPNLPHHSAPPTCAGREVAHQLGMCVLDAASMAAGLTVEQRLSDDSHPSGMVWEEMLNVLLNMWEQHSRAAAMMGGKAAD